jgi:thiol-disulfide isomerase/thioredoxin
MAATPSTMLPLGTPAADFQLSDPATGRTVSLGDVQTERGLLVVFLSNHCPFVKHVKAELIRFGRDYTARGLGVVAIMSNDVERYPDDAPQLMAKEGYPFPYLYDESQEVAKAYRAACTPDFFLFDGQGRLVYRGQLDASRPGNDVAVTGADLRAAADGLLAGGAVPAEQTPSIGCGIKWKPGEEPAYAG